VNPHDVLADHEIALFLPYVTDQKDHIEPGQNRRHQVDIFRGRFHIVVASKDRIGGGQDGRPAVQHRRDSGLGDADRLLFHRLVDRHPVLGSHLVEFVDANDPTVGEDHCPAFQVEFPRRVSHHASRQSRRRGTLSGGVDPDGGGLGHELEKLRLGRRRIAQQQNVNVPPEAHPVRQSFASPTHQHAHQRLFDVHRVRALDAGGD
jgi:hypothetical protein